MIKAIVNTEKKEQRKKLREWRKKSKMKAVESGKGWRVGKAETLEEWRSEGGGKRGPVFGGGKKRDKKASESNRR